APNDRGLPPLHGAAPIEYIIRAPTGGRSPIVGEAAPGGGAHWNALVVVGAWAQAVIGTWAQAVVRAGELRVVSAGALAELGRHGLLLAVAHQRDRHVVVDFVLAQELRQALLLADALAVDLGDHVTLLDASLAGGRVRPDLRHQGAVLHAQVVVRRHARVHRLEANAEVRADHTAAVDELLHHIAHRVAGNPEAEPLGHVVAAEHAGRARAADDRDVDADHLAAGIHQRATRVTVVDRRVRLQQIGQPRRAVVQLAPHGADH